MAPSSKVITSSLIRDENDDMQVRFILEFKNCLACPMVIKNTDSSVH